MAQLDNIRVACVATNAFEYVELVKPREALKNEGAIVEVVSPEEKEIRGAEHLKMREDTIPVDVTITDAKADHYDALLLPGGVANPDFLRLSKNTIEFIRQFVKAAKPIAAICHGPWTLINADGVQGKRMTSWPSLQKDLENAGAVWVDQEVVVDENLVTSRKPDDIPAFCREMISVFSKHKTA